MRNINSNFFRTLLIIFYTAFLILVFIEYINPFLEYENFLQLAADTHTYLNIAKYGDDGSSSTNVMGPVILSRLLGNNNFYILFFNYSLFIISLKLLFSIKNTNTVLLLILTIANPMMLITISTLSKEIIGFTTISISLYLLFSLKQEHKTVKKLWFTPLIIFSFLVRWQMSFVLCTFLLFKFFFNESSLFRSRKISIFILLLFLSAAYPFMRDLGFTEGAEAWAVSDRVSSGAIYFLNELQNQYLFFLVFLPKLMMNLVIVDPSVPARIAEGVAPDGNFDTYNLLIAPIHTIMTGITLLMIWVKKRGIYLQNDSHYFFLIYCAVMSLSPFVQSRYFFPIYAILCLEASSNNSKIIRKEIYRGRSVEPKRLL
jgi:hypothetical protein